MKAANVGPTLLEELAEWASALTLRDIPDRVVRLAGSQVLSQLAAARAGLLHPMGKAVISAFGPPFQTDTKQSACVLAALTSWLQMDDTAYAGHLSNSTVNVPLAYAHQGETDGAALIAAVVAANECAARITASATLGPFRGQSATHTHLAGAVVGRLHLESAPAEQWVDSLALAFGMPPRVLAPAFVASDTKMLNAFTPVRMGLDACDAAAAGLVGAHDILEHPQGFLARFSSIPLPEAVVADMGRRWHTDTLSFKMHPGGPGVDAAVDCAVELTGDVGVFDLDQVAEVVVEASWYTVFVDRRIAGLANPQAPVSVLVVCTPYAVATTLLNGVLTTADFAAPNVLERRRWELAERIRVVHDADMTRDSFRCTVPFGEALRLAGQRAADWDFGALGESIGSLGMADLLDDGVDPSESFEDATKVTGARLTVRLRDGSVFVRQRDIPLGAAGPHTRDHHAELMREKFLATGGSAVVAAAIADLEHLSAAQLCEVIDSALLFV